MDPKVNSQTGVGGRRLVLGIIIVTRMQSEITRHIGGKNLFQEIVLVFLMETTLILTVLVFQNVSFQTIPKKCTKPKLTKSVRKDTTKS
ncbi:MAG: hypothetical protein CL881_00910 [Dehalococcoidia bacterium]|nr:hypothetical protein [Dehalococcoidia bacterium]